MRNNFPHPEVFKLYMLHLPSVAQQKVMRGFLIRVLATLGAALLVVALLVWTPSAMALDSDYIIKADEVPAKLPEAAKAPGKKAAKAEKGAAVVKKEDSALPPVMQQGGQQFPSLPQRVVWNKAPIQVVLGVGADKERRITFPAAMFIGIPVEMEQLLRIQTVDNTSYFTALAPFPATRVIAEDRLTGNVILMDLSAMEGATSSAPIEISMPGNQVAAGTAVIGEDAPPPLDMVELARFASQQLYAPRRLATSRPGLRRVYLEEAPVPNLYRGALVKATPVASWRSTDFWVTAVKLENQAGNSVDLDPTRLRGAWRAAVFQHGRLLPKGDDADTTAVYLISDRPFEEAR